MEGVVMSRETTRTARLEARIAPDALAVGQARRRNPGPQRQ